MVDIKGIAKSVPGASTLTGGKFPALPGCEALPSDPVKLAGALSDPDNLKMLKEASSHAGTVPLEDAKKLAEILSHHGALSPEDAKMVAGALSPEDRLAKIPAGSPTGSEGKKGKGKKGKVKGKKKN